MDAHTHKKKKITTLVEVNELLCNLSSCQFSPELLASAKMEESLRLYCSIRAAMP